MLVLTRLRDQAIIIGHDVEVIVIDIRGDKVRLGIKAPQDVSVHRKEVYDHIHRQGQASPAAKPAVLPATPTGPPDPFLQAAVAEARIGLEERGLPIGAVLVRDGKVIAASHDCRVQKGDAVAHAEIDCLSRAGRQATFTDTVLYSTLMPCLLCSGAIAQLGIPKVVVGDSVNYAGAPDLLRRHNVQVHDSHDPACIALLGQFIQKHPDVWNKANGR